MAEKGESVTENLPKWKLALAVGAPVALALGGVWYYKNKRSKQAKPKDDKGSKDLEKVEAGQSAASPESSGSAASAPSEESMTPLERAQVAKNKGNKYFKGGKYDQAIRCYTEAIDVCPAESKQEIATFYQNRAAAYEQLKDYEQVIADCTSALDYNNKYVKALFRRAKACEIKGKLMQCLEDVTAVCILEGFQNSASLQMADRVLKDLGKAKAKDAFKNRKPVRPSPQFIKTYFSSFAHDPIVYSQASSSSSSSDAGRDSDSELVKDIEAESAPSGEQEKHQEETPEKEKVEGMEKVAQREEVKISPYRQAVECFQSRDYEDIVQLCSMEVNLSTSTHLAESLLLRATFYLLRGEGNKAFEDFDRLMEMKDVDKQIHSNALIKRGSLHMQNGQKDSALADFETAINVDPENSDIYHHRGQLYLLTDRIEDAIRDFQKSLELSPNFALAQVQKCYTDYRLAFHNHSPLQLQKAIQAFEETIEKFPGCPEGYALYGQALCDQQMFDKADENFKKSIELEQNNGNTYVHRGLLRLQWKQEIDEATKFINKAIEVDERCEFAYETLGTIEIQRGNMDKAIELFHKAISLAKTEVEMAHLYSLLDAAVAQSNVAKSLNITIPNVPSFMA